MSNQTTHSVLTFLRLNTTMTDFAYYGISAAMTDQYFIDSGCTRTIVCSKQYMKNMQEIEPKCVKGLSGFKVYNLAGDFPINDYNGIERTLVIKDALFDASGDINLIATDDLNTTNWD
eukprot:2685857-Rhodomonas_salina.1